VRPDLKRKMLWTTLISALIFALIWANSHFGWLTYDMLPGPSEVY
jgi:predicted secreted protein